jgi:Na+/H+ antiporter NhaA
MSLFVAGLAFESAEILEISKIAILVASLVSAVAGCIILTRGDGAEEALEQPETL